MPAALASRRAAATVLRPRFSTSSSRCSPWPEGSKAGSSSTRKSSGRTRKGPDSTGSPWARGSSVLIPGGSGADQQHHRQGGDALAAAGEAQLLGGGRLHGDGVGVSAERRHELATHGLGMRLDLTTISDQREI